MSNRHGRPVIGNEVGAARHDPAGRCHRSRPQFVPASSSATGTSPHSGAHTASPPLLTSRSTTHLLLH
ncbi:hypothetical protein DWU95_27350, partial [Burkholderia contaminans]